MATRGQQSGKVFYGWWIVTACLLAAMVGNAGKVMTTPQLLRTVWGPNQADNAHYLRIYMGHLRHKLEDDPAQPRFWSNQREITLE